MNPVRKLSGKIWQFWLSRQPEDLGRALSQVAEEYAIASRTRRSAANFAKLGNASDLKVHLGCGGDVREGWINIDIGAFPEEIRAKYPWNALNQNKDTVLLEHDLRRGLPLADGSAKYIYSSHFLEHVEFPAMRRLLKDSCRVLAKGGTMRVCLPDFERIFKAYEQRDANYLATLRSFYGNGECTPETESLVDLVHYAVHQYGKHKCVFDREKLRLLFREAGFSEVRDSEFDPAVDVDWEVRKQYSLYMEASKTSDH